MNKIKIKDIEISAEELRRIVKENEALLKEPEVKGRYFFPKDWEEYWYSDKLYNFKEEYKANNWLDVLRVQDGCYRTEADARLASAKQKAIVACWKWQQENAPFEPDWGDKGQDKYHVFYDHNNKVFCSSSIKSNQIQFTLPYFKSTKDTGLFITSNFEHLTLLFTK